MNIRLSPGVVQGCFELLDILSRNSFTFSQIYGGFTSIGGQQVREVVETIQHLDWVHANDHGVAIFTPAGSRLLGIEGYEFRLRQALLDYIDIERPSWLQNAAWGRSRLLSFIGSDIAQVFVEAGLAQGTEDPVISFWDELAMRARGQKQDRLTQIGRQGERLSMEYEKNRTGRLPRWVSVDNNADGYDILSVISAKDAAQLSIEVKTSTRRHAGCLNLSRNEWDRCCESDNHVFHLWAIDSKGAPYLAIIDPARMLKHVPHDQGSGLWEIVEIPFSAFKGEFRLLSAF
jgi:hypothetical protein